MADYSILHVYSSQMTHHLSSMLTNNPKSFPEHKSAYTIVRARDVRTPNPAGSNEYADKARTGIALLGQIFFSDFQFIIFHGGFWPKFWLIALLSTFARKKCVLISWGGDLSVGRGWKGRLNSLLKRMCVSRFFAVVFLAQSDLDAAVKRYGQPRRSALIHYFVPSYLKNARTDRHSTVEINPLRFQIGNDASEINGHLQCLSEISRIDDDGVQIVLPLGYGRFSIEYIDRVKAYAASTFSGRVELYDELLPAEDFDKIIDSCDAYAMASLGQRALYSVFRYLASGRPVFLPRRSDLKADLQALGFYIATLEDISSIGITQIRRSCNEINDNNIKCATEHLSLQGIRQKWSAILKALPNESVTQ